MKLSRINIEVTDICNLDCPGCRRPRDGYRIMSLPMFQQIIKSLKDITSCRKLFVFWRGEPTLVDELPEMVEYARSQKFWVGTATNCSTENLHDEEYVERLLRHLNRLVINVDGYNQETIQIYRKNINWETVLKNLEVINRYNSGRKHEFHTLMFKWNDGKEDFYRDLARKSGFLKMIFKTPIINSSTIISSEEAEKWMSKTYRRYRKVGDNWMHMSKGKCNVRMFCISVDGYVFPCPLNNGENKMDYCFGNILTDSTDKIKRRTGDFNWNLMRKKGFSMCKQCTCLPSVKVAKRERLK